MFFGPIRKPKWLPWPLICWYLFCLLCNCWTQFNETWQEARLRHFDFFSAYVEQIWTNFIDVFYQVLCFSNWSEDQDGCPGLWLADTFFRLLCNRLNEWNLTGRKISTFSNKFAFLGPFWKQRCLPWPQIGQDICSLWKQDISFNIKHQPPFWRRGGVTKQTGTSNNFDKVWSGAPDGCVRKLFSLYSIHNMLVLRCTNVAFLFSGNCSTFATNLQLIFWRSVSFGICFSHSDNFSWALDCLKQINVT